MAETLRTHERRAGSGAPFRPEAGAVAGQQPDPVVPRPELTPEPVVEEPLRLDELLSVDPALGIGVVWLVPAVGFVPIVELLVAKEPVVPVPVVPSVPAVPSVAPPVAAMPHGLPVASTRPVVLEPSPLADVPSVVELGFEAPVFKVLGFDVL